MFQSVASFERMTREERINIVQIYYKNKGVIWNNKHFALINFVQPFKGIFSVETKNRPTLDYSLKRLNDACSKINKYAVLIYSGYDELQNAVYHPYGLLIKNMPTMKYLIYDASNVFSIREHDFGHLYSSQCVTHFTDEQIISMKCDDMYKKRKLALQYRLVASIRPEWAMKPWVDRCGHPYYTYKFLIEHVSSIHFKYAKVFISEVHQYSDETLDLLKQMAAKLIHKYFEKSKLWEKIKHKIYHPDNYPARTFSELQDILE